MTYIIRSVEMRNFLSHESTKLRLPLGSLALVGENGAGKTSVFEAIYYALTGSGWRGKASDLIQLGKQRAEVILELEDPATGSKATARVFIERRGSTATTAYRLTVNGKVVATTATAYREEMAKLLGLHGVTDYKSFIGSAVIIRQGGLAEIASILSSDEGKRLKELVESAIGIPQLEKALEAVRSHTIRVQRSDGSLIMAFDVGPRRRAEVLKAIQAAREVKRAKLQEYHDLEAKLKEAEERLSSLTAELDKVTRASDEACKASSVLEALRQQLREGERSLGEEQARLSRLQGELNDVTQQLASLQPLVPLASLAPLVDELTSLDNRISLLSERARELKPIADAYLELNANRGVHEEYEALRSRLEELREARRKASDELKVIEGQLAQAELLSKSIEQAEQEARAAVGVGQDCDIRCLEEKLRGLESELTEVRARAQELRAQAEAQEARLRELDEVVRLLRRGGREARCPVCGSPLSQERAESLALHYSEEASRLRASAEAARSQAEDLFRRLEDLESRVSRARAAISTASQIMSSLQGLSALSSRLPELKRSVEALNREAEEVERRLKELEQANASYLAALARLEASGLRSPEAAQGVIDELKRVEGELEASKARRAQVERELINRASAKDLAEALAKVKTAVEAAARARVLEGTALSLRSQVSEAGTRVDELRRRVEALRSQVSALEPKARECNELRRRQEGIRTQRDQALKEVAALRSRIEQAKADAERAGEDEEALSRALDELDAALGAMAVVERLEKALYRRALISLENEMNDVFRLFGLDYARVEVRESEDAFYFRVVDRQGVERPVSTLSGGEQIVLSLAYVLALNRIMQSKVGFLLLDEPTDMLDDARRRALVDIIGRVTEEGGVPQLMMITHHTEVVDKVDKVCTVEKDQRGLSKVSCEEGEAA